MKKRIIFVGVIAALLLAGAWWFLANKVTLTDSPKIILSKKLTHGANPVPSSLSPSNVSQTNSVAPAQNPVIPQELNPKVVAMKAIWAGENAKSQDFFGKIIDQYGKPVEGATVIGTLMQIQGIDTGTKKDTHTTQSDENGGFQFTGLHGWQLGVVVKKQGYEMGQGAGFYQAPNHKNISNLSERAIFTMWKLKGAEPMIHTKIDASLACNGTPRNFDVVNARRDAGSLVATYSRSPQNIEKSPTFDYNLTLAMKEGGLIEINHLYPNEAPSDGYQLISVAMRANDPTWTSSMDRSYYFFDGKNYGRLAFHLQANYPPPSTHFTVEAYVNPSGSRNLEYDLEKAKTIVAP
jgi:hypothetical protein